MPLAARTLSPPAHDTTRERIRTRHAVTIAGSGPPLVFAHGFGCDQTMWRNVAPAFERDFTTVTFDYVGMGRSDRRAYDQRRYSTLDGYAQAILDVCHALDLTEVTLVGHSVSASLALLAAIREPERFRRLVLVAPSPRFINDLPEYFGGFDAQDIDGLLALMDQNFIGWAEHLAPAIARNAERPALASELATSFCAADPLVMRRFAELTFRADNRADLPKVRLPSLILQCADDSIAPRSVGEYMARHLRDSVLEIVDAEGHCPHLSHPAATVDAIRRFLAVG
jgi:sigma-B regulation protein RsbQ